jgi:hypothetical protein
MAEPSELPKHGHCYCCDTLALVIEHDHQRSPGANPAGISQAFVFDIRNGVHTRSPVIYVLPGRGRGRAHVKRRNLFIVYCPFCGQKQDPHAK